MSANFIPLDTTWYQNITTHNPTTGAAENASAAPMYAVYEDATATAIVSVTCVTVTGMTGEYYATYAVSAANGFEVGKVYNGRAVATVTGITGKKVYQTFMCQATAVTGGLMMAYVAGVTVTTMGASVTVTAIVTGAITASSIAVAALALSTILNATITGTVAASVGAVSVSAIATGVITATSIATGALAASTVLNATVSNTVTVGAVAVSSISVGVTVTAMGTGVTLTSVATAAYQWLGVIDTGTAQGVTATSITLAATFSATNDVMIGATIFLYNATNGKWDRRVIYDWDGTNLTAYVDAWTVTPTGTISYIVFGTPPAASGTPAPVNLTQVNGTAVVSTTAHLGVKVVSFVTGAFTASAIATGAVSAVTLGAVNVSAMAVNVTVTTMSVAVTVTAIVTGAITASALATAALASTTILNATVSNTITVGTVAVTSIATGAVTASAIATGALALSTLAAEATNIAAIVTGVLDTAAGVETGLTVRQWFRLAAAALFNKGSGLAGTTAVYRDFGDTKARITATVDSSGNRTAVTTDAT